MQHGIEMKSLILEQGKKTGPVHHAVTLKEMVLFVNWLNFKYGKKLRTLNKAEAEHYIKAKFKKLLSRYYSE